MDVSVGWLRQLPGHCLDLVLNTSGMTEAFHRFFDMCVNGSDRIFVQVGRNDGVWVVWPLS